MRLAAAATIGILALLCLVADAAFAETRWEAGHLAAAQVHAVRR